MSVRWSSYVAPKPPKGGSKTQNGRVRCKIALHLKKVGYKVSLCENCQQQSCRAFIGLTIHASSTWNFGSNWLRWSEIADFLSIFVCSTSAITPIEKVQLTLIRSALRTFQWAQDEHHTLSLKHKVSKIWTMSVTIIS